MNYTILNQYGIQFYKTTTGFFGAKSENHGILCVVIKEFQYPTTVISLLSDIDLALSGQYNQLIDYDITVDRGYDMTIWGIINDDMTFSVSVNSNPEIEYPLSDIKEIFTSWLEFLQQ